MRVAHHYTKNPTNMNDHTPIAELFNLFMRRDASGSQEDQGGEKWASSD